MKFSHILRSALRVAVQRIRFPLTRIHSYNWSGEDHCHICYAARLLEADDFLAVCPLSNRKPWVEHEDYCDECPYSGCVYFKQAADGTKWIDLW